MDLVFHALVLPALCLAAWPGRAVGGGGWTRLLGAFVAADAIALGLALAAAQGPFHCVRLVTWLAFLYLPLELLVLAWTARASLRVAAAFGATALAVWAVAADAFWIEPHWLETTSIQLEAPAVVERTRIVVLADIQTDHIARYERDALARVAALEPDLVLLAGDYLQLGSVAREREARAFRELFVGIEPRLGIWAVRGNVDAGDWQKLFVGTTVHTLAETATVSLSSWLSLTGLSLSDSFNRDLRVTAPADGYRVVFGHGPDFALGRIDAELLIAGHTHGGQVRLPLVGPLLTLSAVPRSWASGRTALGGGRTLIVSRGVGMERGLAPRLRFLCRPQLIVVDLLPAGQGGPVPSGL